MTGSAIAIPLLGAGSASAVESSTWDRIAECESGGSWSADTGNGYYGGLQLSQAAWEAHGGTEYASRADLASRSQQIIVAEKVLAAQGVKAWASCAGIAGLTDGAPAGNGTGSTGTDAAKPDKAPAAGKPKSAPKPAAEPKSAETPAGRSTAAEPSAGTPKGAGPGAGTSAGKHRGEPATESPASGPEKSAAPTGTGEPKSDGTAGPGPARGSEPGHVSRGDSGGRSPVADTAAGEKKVEVVKGVDGADAEPGTYTVRPGDSLWAIAQEQKLDEGWTGLYEANREEVGADPDLIHPGQSLALDPK
ncbi:transglycosylase family protein [Streptomyces sp. CAU 1734]|uniref:transglycosylase family protein n=1 Tax=Streptomyces sp. CAU 1734 TaxID=3140360 RepID=UPI0032600978